MTNAKAYRRKVTYTTAEQFLVDGPRIEGVMVDTDCRPYVVTAHDQRAYLADGDWVIPEATPDRFYPCKSDVFEENYELVPAATEGEPIAPALDLDNDFDFDKRYFGFNVRKDALAFAISSTGPNHFVGDPKRILEAAKLFGGYLSAEPTDPVMPELKPTLKMQDGTEPPPHVARMLVEYLELDERRKKLGAFIDKNPIFDGLSHKERDAMADQHIAMGDYYGALMRRLAYAGAMTS